MIDFKGIEFASGFLSEMEKVFQSKQKYVDNEVVKRLEDYTPISMKRGYSKTYKKFVEFTNRGKMSKSHKIERPGVIINTEPKARREYYINKGFSGKLRGKLWLERMKADHKDDILKGLKK